MAELDGKKIDLSALEEDKLWDLLAAAHTQVTSQVQEIAQRLWPKAEKLICSSGFNSIKDMIPAPPRRMPIKSKLIFQLTLE